MTKLVSSKEGLQVLRKHTAAIHIGAEGFGLMHKKSVNAALFLAREIIKTESKGDLESYLDRTSDMEINHEVSLSEFKTLINYNSNDNVHLKSVLRKLTATPVEFEVIGKNKEDDAWASMALLSMAKINGSVVSFRFPSELRSRLLNPSVYAQISLGIQNLFSSDHALSLYENTFRYSKLGETPWIKIEDFRKLMGIREDSYPEFKYLNREVIQKAMKEINKVSNIGLTAEFGKLGRNVSKVRFQIQLKQERDFFIPDDAEFEHSELELRLNDYGLSESQIKSIFKLKDVIYLETKLAWLDNKTKIDASSIKNLPAFVYKAIMEDYEEAVVTKPLSSETPSADSKIVASSSQGEKLSLEQITKYAPSEILDTIKQAFKDEVKKRNARGDDVSALVSAIFDEDWEREPLKTDFAKYASGYVFVRHDVDSQIRHSMQVSS